ncbi:MAG: glycoside hydrolase family 2 protein [Anaerolineae bacterium]
MTYRPNRIKFNQDWCFCFEDDQWEDVQLPHTWNALDTMSTDPDWHYRRGVGIYEKHFQPPDDVEGRTLWLEFEAVAQKAKVYFDDELLTEHYGGYTAFVVNIPNCAGTIRVEADNTPDPDLIPSDLSDFFLYGGITRNVWFYTTDRAWLATIRCEIVATDIHARLKVYLTLGGDYHRVEQVAISLQGIGFPTLYHVDTDDASFDKEITVDMPLIEGDAYKKWSPDNPNLYQLRVGLYGHGLASEELDLIEEKIGFRSFEFPKHGVFYLNGDRLLLRGTHRHEDWAGYGGAVPDEITRKEFQMIKDAGFNFVRLGHYPQSRAALETCDELGIIVWEEIPWCRGGVGGDTFKEHTRTMLHEMITQHYNHPSVIFWGLGNELDWVSEHPDSTDDKVCNFLQELNDTTHKLDPSRLTALRRFDYGAQVVDVYSPSIWAGWYRGKYTDYEQNLRDAMVKYPRFLHAEWGGDSHAGRFRQSPHIDEEPQSTVDNAEVDGTATNNQGFTRYSKDGDWSESYILKLMDHHLMVQNKLVNFAGGLQWAFKDFGTPLRPENPIPYVNQKGLLTRDGTPKRNYHLFCDWNLNQNSDPVWPVDDASTFMCSDFTLSCDDNRLQVTLIDNAGNRTIGDEHRVQFFMISGGDLVKNRGYMGGSDVIETSNGRAWITLLPDKNSEQMTIHVTVEGLGVKEMIITRDHYKP